MFNNLSVVSRGSGSFTESQEQDLAYQLYYNDSSRCESSVSNSSTNSSISEDSQSTTEEAVVMSYSNKGAKFMIRNVTSPEYKFTQERYYELLAMYYKAIEKWRNKGFMTSTEVRYYTGNNFKGHIVNIIAALIDLGENIYELFKILNGMAFSFHHSMTDIQLQDLQKCLSNISIVHYISKNLRRLFVGKPDVNGNPIIHVPVGIDDILVDVLYGVSRKEGYLESKYIWRHFVNIVDIELQSRDKEVHLFTKYMDSSGFNKFLARGSRNDPVANYWP